MMETTAEACKAASLAQMTMEDLKQMEMLCTNLFAARNEQERQHAHSILLKLVDDPTKIPLLLQVLMSSTQSHTLVFATNALMKLITNHWSSVSTQQKEQMREFMFSYLAGSGAQAYISNQGIIAPFIRLLCRLLKLAWLEGPQHQDVVEKTDAWLENSTAHCIVGLELYTELTQDMQPTPGANMSRYRRTALCFRDTALPQIFEKGLRTLQKLSQGQLKIADKKEENLLVKQLLKLIQNCLSFDFMGTLPDLTLEEEQTVMIPHSWQILREEGITNLFFEIYSSCCSHSRMDCAARALECLVLVASLRRSFFQNDNDRNSLLKNLISGTSGILSVNMGTQDPDCYHALCRLLGKINAAHQLSELITVDAFQQWMQNVYTFTTDSLIAWESQPNSKHYLLQFWSNLVNPMLHMKNGSPRNLDRCIQQITLSYIESRLAMAEAAANPDLMPEFCDPLEQEVLRTEQLEVLSNLGKCQYQETANVVIKHFEEILRRGKDGSISQTIFEKKMAWIVYMMGALVSGHSNNNLARARTETPQDPPQTPPHVINGELAVRVFQLISLTDQDKGRETLELAYLYFLEQFRKVYIGEHAKQVNVTREGVQERLATVLGVSDENGILGLLINKIGKNLQYRCEFEQVVLKTLALFHELAAGINIVHTAERSPHLIVSGRLLLKNDMVQYIMKNHAAPEFGFLYFNLKYGKYRSQYYHTLGKLLFMEAREEVQSIPFNTFMAPLAHVIDTLKGMAAQDQNSLKREPEAKIRIIGLCRDLRGLALACTSPESYGMLFSWLVQDAQAQDNNRINLFYQTLDVFWDDYEVTTPLLKFMAEFCYNKAQRINFDQSSANGILLFREASKIMTTYGNRILAKDFGDFKRNDSSIQTVPTPNRNLYQAKYKGIGVSLDLFGHALQGNYCNFGVFEIYGDQSLANSMSLALRMGLAIPPVELQAYMKTFRPFYTFLDLTSKNHIRKLFELSPNELAMLLANVEEGLCSFEVSVTMQCCSIIDNIGSFFVEQKEKQTPEGDYTRRFLSQQPECLKKMLNLMFQLIMSGEFSSTWSISRPLLGLILLHEQEYIQLKDRLIAMQIDDKKTKLKNFFEELMGGVENNLTGRNKDHFTRQLYTFAQMVKAL